MWNFINNGEQKSYGIKKQHTNRQNGPGYGKKKVINEDNTAQVINGRGNYGESCILYTICVSWKWPMGKPVRCGRTISASQ